MEIKDILGLVFTFIFLVAFQFLGRPKKKPPHIPHEATPPMSRKKEKLPLKKAAPLRPLGSLEKSSSFPKNVEAYATKKRDVPSLGKTLLHDKNSLRKAFICQEVLHRPYD